MSSGREATVTDHAGLWGPDNIVFGRGSTPVVDKPFRVLVAGTDTLAQLYTDRDRTDTASNPGSTGPLGNVSFYADPGYYDLVVGETTLTVLVPLDPADGGSTGGGGGDPGVVLSDATPQAPGAAGPGVSVEASRADHRHAPPTAGQIGAATPADIEAAIDALAAHASRTTDAHGGIVAATDPRLSDARTPTAHAASHGAGGSDPITIDTTGLVPTSRTIAGLDLTTDRTAPALRTALGVVPGVDVQPADSDLTAIAALATTTWGRALLTLADAAAARTVFDAAATGHVHDASAITTGVVAAARLGSGTASVGTMLTGAGTWAPRGYKLIAGQPYDGGSIKSGTAVTTQNRVAWTTLEGLALGAQVDALWVDVTTGGSTGATVQLSLLADDGWGRPGALLAQTAQLPAETSTAIVMGTFGAVTLTTSTIHIGVHVRSTAQPTLRAISSRATCIPAGPVSTSNTMAWSSTIAGAAVAANPAVDVSSAACYRAGIRGA